MLTSRLVQSIALVIYGLTSIGLAHSDTTNPAQKPPSKEIKKPQALEWHQLSPLQQAVLASLEPDWSSFTSTSKTKWLKVANRYPSMSSAEQERLQARMAAWAKLPQKDRRLARDNYLSSLQFPAEQKAAAWEAYQQLSDEEKQKLAQQELNKKKTGAATAPAIQPRALTNSPSGNTSNSTIK